MNPSNCYPRLLGDIGGTNARFAWQESAGAALTNLVTLLGRDYTTIDAAVQSYLTTIGKHPRWAAFGIANPITGDFIKMTNHHWSFSIQQLQSSLDFEELVVVNDFTALALSLPKLRATDVRQIGRGLAVPDGPIAVIGPGTGLGVSGLLCGEDGTRIPIEGEGGHVTLAVHDKLEFDVIQFLQKRFSHVSAERVLSGPGLVNIYEALCALSGQKTIYENSAQIVQGVQNQKDPIGAQTLQLFFGFLGSTAGNLALTLGAHGGVYLGGGILPQLIESLTASTFREKFESKGRFNEYLARIPTFVITSTVSPALVGASEALDQRLLRLSAAVA